MEKTYSEAIRKIRQNQKKLEQKLKVNLSFSGNNISISGKPIDEYVACQVIEAIDLGFKTDEALLLCEEGFIFEKINIKDLTKRHDLSKIRARIIGRKGKTKEIIENLSECLICLHDNAIGVIGQAENINKCITALSKLIQGSKQGKVYTFLEGERSKAKAMQFEDLGLKNKEKTSRRGISE